MKRWEARVEYNMHHPGVIRFATYVLNAETQRDAEERLFDLYVGRVVSIKEIS